MGRQVWQGDDLYWLLNLPTKELEKLYTKYSRSTIKGKKGYWLKQLREGKIEMPPKPEKEPKPYDELLSPFGLEAPEDAEVGFHVGFIKNSEGEIEYTRPLPSVRSAGRKKRELSDFISQADPVRIVGTRRKPIERDYRLIVAFGDNQIDYRQIDGVYVPIHDERVMRVTRMICQEYMPETIVNLGDTIDLAQLSRFAPDSDHFRHSMNPAFNRVHQMYAELRADNPDARIVEVDSNHNTRLSKFIIKQVPELYGIQQAGANHDYPVMTYPFLANLGAVGVEWVSGYGAAEFLYGEEYDAPPILFRHGNTVVSNGSTAAKESAQNPDVHVVRGHGHRAETHHRTTRSGHYLTSMMVGCSCRVDGHVPSYHSAVSDRGEPVKTQENWQQGIAIITDYMNGRYQFDHILINEGIAHYEGRVFDGTEPA